jgi:hypothetical protein
VITNPQWADMAAMLKRPRQQKPRCPHCGGLFPDIGWMYAHAQWCSSTGREAACRRKPRATARRYEKSLGEKR